MAFVTKTNRLEISLKNYFKKFMKSSGSKSSEIQLKIKGPHSLKTLTTFSINIKNLDRQVIFLAGRVLLRIMLRPQTKAEEILLQMVTYLQKKEVFQKATPKKVLLIFSKMNHHRKDKSQSQSPLFKVMNILPQ